MATKTTRIKQEIEEQVRIGDPQDPKTKMARILSDARDRTVEYDGSTYTISSSALDDVEVVEMLEDGKYISAVRRLVGADSWECFKAAYRTDDGRVPMSALEGFLQAVMGGADSQVAS